MTKDFFYTGFLSPNTTPVPDDVFDVIAPELTEAELRVLLYVVRRTFGFNRERDAISLSQMVDGITTRDGRVLDRGTGMSRRGVMGGCAGLIEKGIITVEKRLAEQGDNEINIYSLRFREERDGRIIRGVGNKVPYGRERSAPGVGNEVAPQETVIQETDFNHSNIRKSNRSNDDFVDNPPSQPIRFEANRSVSRNGSETHHGVEGVGSIMNRVAQHMDAAPPVKRPRGRPRKFQDQESQTLLNYVSDFAREFADKATLNQSATRMINLYHRWGKGDIDAFVGVLYQARSVTKAQNNIRTSKFAYFCSVVEDLLGLREEQNAVRNSGT